MLGLVHFREGAISESGSALQNCPEKFKKGMGDEFKYASSNSKTAPTY
ncbi:MAG: hypothetical protein R3C24_15985 [Cyanobacteriota/Melainabacteria group bacterium]